MILFVEVGVVLFGVCGCGVVGWCFVGFRVGWLCSSWVCWFISLVSVGLCWVLGSWMLL